jgi:hypothetical protein
MLHQKDPLWGRAVLPLALDDTRPDAIEFSLTQEFLAMMLGVRRPSVSTATGALQRRGLIRYVKILDREGLQHLSCECYRVTKVEFESSVA